MTEKDDKLWIMSWQWNSIQYIQAEEKQFSQTRTKSNSFSITGCMTWDWRRPPNMCWIIVVSWEAGSTAFSPPNSSRQTDCIVSIANLQKRQKKAYNIELGIASNTTITYSPVNHFLQLILPCYYISSVTVFWGGGCLSKKRTWVEIM
jgi:hypothetical protein